MLTLDHPYIVKFYESYDDARFIYLIMQFCNGGDIGSKLDKFAKDGRVFTEHIAARYMYQMLDALMHSHANNIVHRDIKLENCMLDSDDNTKMCDFGLSNYCVGAEKMTLVTGTPYYLAPEVTLKKYGKECDLWSLGVTLYYLIEG